MPRQFSKIVCLSNVHDDNYASARGEAVTPSLSSPKRRDLFACVQSALGIELVIVSSPPKATARRRGKWLSALQTRFGRHPQFFAPNWDVPKLRIPLSWLFYTIEALKRTARGDLVILDNYELIYVIAAYWLKWLRRTIFVLDYEDGKHLIDRGWSSLLSGTAEGWGRRLLSAAFVSHPALAARLPVSVPWELVPGFVVPSSRWLDRGAQPDTVRFLYSGSLDQPRGIDLILEVLPLLPETGWSLDITGAGPYETQVARVANEKLWKGRARFHGQVPGSVASAIAQSCHIGLNCQRASDPISSVTFPSKIFSYLSAGIAVISSRASDVPAICGKACQYYDRDTADSLAAVMLYAIRDFAGFRRQIDETDVTARFSLESTAVRLRKLLGHIESDESPRPD